MRRGLERVLWAVFAATSIAVCARGTRTPWLGLFVFPALVASAIAWRGPSEGAKKTADVALGIVAVPALLLGWVLMAYPVLPPDFVRLATLVVASGLCALVGLVALCPESPWRSMRLGTTSLLAIAVGGFDAANEITGVMRVAGVAALALLAVGRISARRALRLALASTIAVVVAEATARVLPPAQDRVEAALAGLATRAASGASTHARLGEMEALQLSREIVLRAYMPSARRLRVRVYSRFDGQTWHPGAGGLASLLRVDAADALVATPGVAWRPPTTPGGRTEQLRVVAAGLAPGTLAVPRGVVLLRAPFEAATIDDAGVVLPPGLDRVAVYGALYLPEPPPREPDAATLATALAVPADTDPRLHALASELAAGLSDPLARAHRVASFVSTRARYTVDPGPFRTKQPLAEFLFEKRAGYCEYFASASAVLLRLMGVPARYVTGYAVQEWSRSGDHYVVRAADTHAWIEAWAGPERGWIELDPTPAAEYDARRRALSPGLLERLALRVRGEFASLVATLRAGELRALVELARERPWLALPLLLAAAPLVQRLGRLRPRRPVVLETSAPVAPPELRWLRRRHDAALVRLGVPRPANRGLVEHALALPAGLPADARARVLDSAEALSAARFGSAPIGPAAQAAAALERAASAIRE